MNAIHAATGDLLYRWACLPAEKRSQITALDPGMTACLDALEHEFALAFPGWFNTWSAAVASAALKIQRGKLPPR